MLKIHIDSNDDENDPHGDVSPALRHIRVIADGDVLASVIPTSGSAAAIRVDLVLIVVSPRQRDRSGKRAGEAGRCCVRG